MVNRNEVRPVRSESSSLNQRHASADVSLAKKYNTDDVIMSLANAYENKRARQVGEWESMQHRFVRRAAA